MHRQTVTAAAVLAVALSAAGSAGAQQQGPQNVEIHGFGSWNSGATNNENEYLGGKWKGSSLNSNAGVNLSGDLGERVSFTTQVTFEFNGATTPKLDYVFAEYKFSDQLKLRAGQVKQPFGLYTEVMNIGTLHPFLTLAQSQYGPTGTVADAYRGLGFTGNLRLLENVSLDYDVYGGGLNRSENEFTLDMYRGLQGRKSWDDVSHEVGSEVTDQLYGGRLMFNLPVDGLRAGASGYHSQTGEAQAGRGWVSTVGYGLEYNANRTTFRSEVYRQWENDHDRQNGWYYEGAYRVLGGWQLAGRFDRTTVHPKGAVPAVGKNGLPPVSFPALGESLLRHKELAGGVNYIFSSNFVMKASYHHVEGNHFAQPDAAAALAAYEAAAMAGSTTIPIPTKTNSVLLGAQFSF
jgi:hypothetical protein